MCEGTCQSSDTISSLLLPAGGVIVRWRAVGKVEFVGRSLNENLVWLCLQFNFEVTVGLCWAPAVAHMVLVPRGKVVLTGQEAWVYFGGEGWLVTSAIEAMILRVTRPAHWNLWDTEVEPGSGY